MIVVAATIESTPENVDAMRKAILTMQAATLEEDGCEDYTFSVELGNAGNIRIAERWTSKEALAAHFATPHMADFQAAMAAHPPKSVDARFYEATEIEFPG